MREHPASAAPSAILSKMSALILLCLVSHPQLRLPTTKSATAKCTKSNVSRMKQQDGVNEQREQKGIQQDHRRGEAVDILRPLPIRAGVNLIAILVTM